MRKLLSALAIGSLTLGSGLALTLEFARADTLVGAGRSILARSSFNITTGCNGPLVSNPAAGPASFGHWAAGVSAGGAAASQDSLIEVRDNTTELSGTGTVSMSVTCDYAESRFDAVFSVDAATGYDFNVSNLNPAACLPWTPSGSVKLNMVNPGNPSMVLQTLHSVTLGRIVTSSGDPSCGMGLPGLSAVGTLAPGTYSLDYLLDVTGSRLAAAPGTAGFSLLLDSALAIPEPDTLLLLGGGIAGLVVFGRTKRGGGCSLSRSRGPRAPDAT